MAHQQPGKRSRFFNRLFPWRSSGAARRSSSGSRMMTGLRDPSTRLFSSGSSVGVGASSSSVGGSSSVRRTSPVDLNLGSEASPASLDASSLMHELPLRRRFDLNDGKPRASAQPDLLAEQVDKEELGALRHLASELHTALRLSEEENLLLKAKLQTLDDWGLTSNEPFMFSSLSEPLCSSKSNASKLDQLIDDLRDIASSQPTSPFSSPMIHRRNMRDLGRILHQRQTELRRLTNELQETQTELLFTKVELEQVRRCLHRLDQRLMCAEDELDMARQELLQASISKQRLMQELQTTRGLLMRCWSRVRQLEQQDSHRIDGS